MNDDLNYFENEDGKWWINYEKNEKGLYEPSQSWINKNSHIASLPPVPSSEERIAALEQALLDMLMG